MSGEGDGLLAGSNIINANGMIFAANQQDVFLIAGKRQASGDY
jgi:hypothetical protein